MEIGGAWDMSYGYLFFRPAWFEPQIASRRLVIERGTVSGRAALLWRCTEVNHYLTSSLYFVSLKAFGSISFNLRKSLKKKEGKKERKRRKKKREKKGGEYKSRIIKLLFIFSPFFYLPVLDKNGARWKSAPKSRPDERSEEGRDCPPWGGGVIFSFLCSAPPARGGPKNPPSGGKIFRYKGYFCLN